MKVKQAWLRMNGTITRLSKRATTFPLEEILSGSSETAGKISSEPVLSFGSFAHRNMFTENERRYCNTWFYFSNPLTQLANFLFSLRFFWLFQTKLKSPAASLTLVADILARIANTDRGLALFLHETSVVVAHGERWDSVTESRFHTQRCCCCSFSC